MLSGAALAVDASPAAAYCTAPSGWVVSKWTGTPRVTMWQTNSIPDSWLDDLQASSAQWNGISGSNWAVGTVGKSWQGPVVHKGSWYMNASGPAGGFGGAPGITQLSFQPSNGGTITWANIFLNSSFSWNTNGVLNQSTKQADIRTVATHELGHLLMLHHPGACHTMSTAEKAAVMNVTWTKKWSLNSDDKAGAAAMY
jgi:Matrixin